jgi:ABC-type transport system substrate-binding protein
MNTPPARHVSRRSVLRGAATLAGMAIVSPLVVACGGAANTPAGGTSATVPISGAASVVAATPKIGGVLTYAQNQPIKTLDSLNPQTYPASYEAIYALYNTLVSFAPDLKIVPALAERWERSADNLTWTFHLRSGVKFHDGTPFNAQAVVAHVKRIQDPKNASPNKNLWDHIVDTKVVDDTTVQLITGKPFGAMLNYLAHSSGGIASPDAVAKYAADYPTHPVGTGPYQLSAFNAGTDLTLVRNESFYGGKPRLDRVVFRSITETGSRVALIDAGEADLANDVPAEDAGRLAKGASTQLLRQQGMRTFFMEFNLTLPIFKDQKVRQALNYAVNKEAIATSLFQGYAQVLDSPAAGTMQGHKKCGAYPYDVAKAKQMLADAGWKAGPGGILQKDGTPLKFAINTAEGEYPKDIQVVEAVQADLKAVGCDVSIWKVEAAARYSYLRLPSSEAKYEMVSFGFNPSNGDLGYHLNSLFRSNPDKTKAPYVWNLMWYENQQVDTLLTQAEQSVDGAQRADLLGQVQQIVWDEAPMIWLYAPDLLVAAQKNVQGLYVWPTIFTVVRDAWKS